jgi:hypothetical protein
LHDPRRTDVLLAIWTVLALPEADGAPGLPVADANALTELYDDLHRDLRRAEKTADEDFEDLAIALP